MSELAEPGRVKSRLVVNPLDEQIRPFGVPFARPQTVLVCNFTGAALRQVDGLRQAPAGQIARTVPRDRCMDTSAEPGGRCVLEVGPGSSLSRLWQGRHPSISARAADEFGSRQAVDAGVRSALAPS